MYEKLPGFDSSGTSSLTVCTSPLFYKYIIETCLNKCTVQNASRRENGENCIGSQNYFSSCCHGRAVTFVTYMQPYFSTFTGNSFHTWKENSSYTCYKYSCLFYAWGTTTIPIYLWSFYPWYYWWTNTQGSPFPKNISYWGIFFFPLERLRPVGWSRIIVEYGTWNHGWLIKKYWRLWGFYLYIIWIQQYYCTYGLTFEAVLLTQYLLLYSISTWITQWSFSKLNLVLIWYL